MSFAMTNLERSDLREKVKKRIKLKGFTISYAHAVHELLFRTSINVFTDYIVEQRLKDIEGLNAKALKENIDLRNLVEELREEVTRLEKSVAVIIEPQAKQPKKGKLNVQSNKD
jgi:cell division septum initiation protein DivIVA